MLYFNEKVSLEEHKTIYRGWNGFMFLSWDCIIKCWNGWTIPREV